MRRAAALGALFILSLVGCERSAAPIPATPGAAPVVRTSFYPCTYFASRIAGDAVSVVCPVPPEADPALWQPSRDELAAFQKADLTIINGAGFEKWIETAALPESRLVDSTASLRADLLKYDSVTHSHGPGGAHSHVGIDGHTWLDPVNAKAQAARIARALTERWPAHARPMQVRFDALTADLDALDARLISMAPRARTALLLASHPAYNYLSRRYSLGVVNIAMNTESLPDDAAIKAIGRAVTKTPDAEVRIMLWEQEPPADSARLLRERFGIHSVHFSPCESLDPDDAKAGLDFISMMNLNLARLEQALRGDQ